MSRRTPQPGGRRGPSMLALAALLLAAPWHGGAQTRNTPPSPQEIEAMARELQEKQRERERLSERRSLVPLQELSALPDFAVDRKFAYLRLTNRMDALAAIWTLLPSPTAKPEDETREAVRPEPIVALLPFRGDEWLRLEPGNWLMQLETGSAGSDLALTMAPRAIELKAGRAYALELNEQTEQQLRKLLQRMARPAQQTEGNNEPATAPTEPIQPEAPPE